jgi:lysozyme
MKIRILILLLCILAVEACMLYKKPEVTAKPVVIPCKLEMAQDVVPRALPFQNDAQDKLVRLIMDHEGFKSKVYLCPAGKKTIGYGFTGSRYISKKRMTEGEARNILVNEIIPATRCIVKRYVKVSLSPYQEAALISFCFNCGEANLRNLVSRKDRLNDGNFSVIPSLMKLYVKADGKTLKGLVKRRDQEARLFAGKV